MLPSPESKAFFEALEDPDQTAPGPDLERRWDFLKRRVPEVLHVVRQLFSSADSPVYPTELFPVAPQE